MIRYALICSGGHEFESWFRDSMSYDQQRGHGLLACPHCGDHCVEKKLMAPAIAARETALAMRAEAAESGPPQPTQPVALGREAEREMRAVLRAFRHFVEANSEQVGDRFAEEARKIHYGEAEHRAIVGRATPGEVKELREDGIDVSPLPLLPEEQH